MTSPTLPRLDPPPSLLETMRFEQDTVLRLERHLARMRAAAVVFGYPWHEGAVRTALSSACSTPLEGPQRVRLLVDAVGAVSVSVAPHRDVPPGTVWRIAFANTPVNAHDPRLVHKTTAREPYETARRSRPDVDDVVLWNESNEVTESTIANLVAEIDGVKMTPPVSSGLLAGVLRGELLESGEIREGVIARGVLARASRVWLINSLRGWIDATLVR